MTRDLTSIKIGKETRDRLKTHKTGGETYDQLINKMIDKYDLQEVAK